MVNFKQEDCHSPSGFAVTRRLFAAETATALRASQ